MGFIFIMIISMVALCKELECRLQAAAHHLGCTYALFCPPAKQCCLFVVVVDQAPLWLTLASQHSLPSRHISSHYAEKCTLHRKCASHRADTLQ